MSKTFATTYHPSKTISTVSHMHSNDEGFQYALTVRLLLLTGGKVLPSHAKVHIVHAMQLPAVWWSGRIKTCLEHKVWCCIFS